MSFVNRPAFRTSFFAFLAGFYLFLEPLGDLNPPQIARRGALGANLAPKKLSPRAWWGSPGRFWSSGGGPGPDLGLPGTIFYENP